MADESPYIDYENLPAPSEGIIATLFITVRKVAQSRDSIRVGPGREGRSEENPCMVKLANTWIINESWWWAHARQARYLGRQL